TAPRTDRSRSLGEASPLCVADRVRIRAVRARGAGRNLASAGARDRDLCGETRGRWLPACAVRYVDREDARIPGSGIPRSCAHARSARDPAAVRLPEPLDARQPRFRCRPPARGLACPGELHAALSGPALCIAERLCAPCLRARAFGGMAGAYPECAASL